MDAVISNKLNRQYSFIENQKQKNTNSKFSKWLKNGGKTDTIVFTSENFRLRRVFFRRQCLTVKKKKKTLQQCKLIQIIFIWKFCSQ